ncbi:MAG: bifunctional 5,10-methylenetetrahydrofolate dehydrogenase/5,10-methenyltetrahydrofolate cyclohydrolase [Bdellovibrionaceae bacterium]|nr:bifunctional 5,10-methylenetetrahydrofolate dehydrogenase/5,10-methenyltetrahydrofolate cyclohydrolase [Pseudobdellovibrionaceae bacterium]
MQILDGKLVSQTRRAALKPRIEAFREKTGRAPHLAVVLVGNVVASHVYVRNKEKSCADVGLQSSRIDLPETITQAEFNAVLDRLNQDDGVDGILVQLPLPKALDADEVNRRLRPDKDADGFTFETLGHLWSGQKIVAPCTPQGVMSILSHYQIPVAGKYAVVVGRSMIVGKPMAHLLTEADATVTLCHSKTPNLGDFTRKADIVVVAAGKRHLLGKDDFKQGAVVIDVGMHGTGDGKGLAGDVRLSELNGWVASATPVPGGVGPMTITTLLENTVLLAEKRKGLTKSRS